jgi:hypothetical protein
MLVLAAVLGMLLCATGVVWAAGSTGQQTQTQTQTQDRECTQLQKQNCQRQCDPDCAYYHWFNSWENFFNWMWGGPDHE